ncbi:MULTISPECIES: thiamine diphosphokinase [unclassified Erysipelothrix]|uniref:thiamine diphosphokinase n=1 Tax=unclassified Erysipelothrix TaxID=2624170 RepID=UPI0013788F83|nr:MULTISPECIES: thiamine diphosphokinase [unclassified Erysipelothrix]MBK2402299.1 thiamine diphosphokinase [Erysipelothrix sp. strain 2 (EsS2-6-Brazil)]MBK2404460.1 thiamine diphosphokinase [Erysipelothrix sp. strain 2 (EsS2-7-Brazil)]NBA01973.1 thiamine diphosphokinase [Erysipelothrix rhusiopathiae]
MKTVTIVLGEHHETIIGDVIGVDFGAYVCARDGVAMTLACGDFDSVTTVQFKEIELHCSHIHKLNPIKDETDFKYAYSLCDDYDIIRVLGGLGRRKDHEFINIMTAMKDSRIELYDGLNKIKRYDSGSHIVDKLNYKYFSVVVLKQGYITLKGFKYPLTRREIFPFDDYLTSNEMIHDKGEIILEDASVLVIQACDS